MYVKNAVFIFLHIPQIQHSAAVMHTKLVPNTSKSLEKDKLNDHKADS